MTKWLLSIYRGFFQLHLQSHPLSFAFLQLLPQLSINLVVIVELHLHILFSFAQKLDFIPANTVLLAFPLLNRQSNTAIYNLLAKLWWHSLSQLISPKASRNYILSTYSFSLYLLPVSTFSLFYLLAQCGLMYRISLYSNISLTYTYHISLLVYTSH